MNINISTTGPQTFHYEQASHGEVKSGYVKAESVTRDVYFYGTVFSYQAGEKAVSSVHSPTNNNIGQQHSQERKKPSQYLSDEYDDQMGGYTQKRGEFY